MLKTYNVKIPANGHVRMGVQGNFVSVTSATADFRLETLKGDRVVLREGKNVELTEFKEFTLYDESGVDNILVIDAGIGKISDNEMSGSVGLASPSTLSTTADQTLTADTATVISAADTTRREIMIRAPKTNTVNIRIGDSDVGAARGIELEPGQTITLTTAAAVYGYPDGGAAVVQVLEGAN